MIKNFQYTMISLNVILISMISSLLLFTLPLLSQDRQRLGESELKSAKRINFINRENSKADRSTSLRQLELGRSLGERINREPSREARNSGISIQRLTSKDTSLFGADLISLTSGLEVGHINSLIRIFSGYIQEAFEYPQRDSEIIAKYLLYYNAMHRNEKSYFKERYIPAVTEKISVQAAGLSRNYRDWGGSSQLILPLEYSSVSRKVEIPLVELEKEVEKLNSETKVIPDGEKKRLIEIIKENKKEEERIVKLENEKRLEEKINNSPEKKTIPSVEKKDTEKSSTAQGKSENSPEKSPAKEKIPQETTETKSPPTQKDAIKKDEESNPKPPTKEEAIASLETKKEEKPQSPEPPKEKDPLVEKLQKENEELKAKEKEKELKSENVVGDKILFLRLVKYEDDGHYTNELWMIDGKNEETIYRSPYTNICGKEFHVLPKGGVVVIGFDGNRPTERIHRLVLLDGEKLSQKSVSKNEIFYRSHLIVRDDKIYAFEKVKDQVYFTRFNPDMTMDVRSSEPVGTNSEITFFNDKIFLTGRGSEQEETVIRVMQKSDLKITKTLKPLERKR